jgi:hypothetical protein
MPDQNLKTSVSFDMFKVHRLTMGVDSFSENATPLKVVSFEGSINFGPHHRVVHSLNLGNAKYKLGVPMVVWFCISGDFSFFPDTELCGLCPHQYVYMILNYIHISMYTQFYTDRRIGKITFSSEGVSHHTIVSTVRTFSPHRGSFLTQFVMLCRLAPPLPLPSLLLHGC